MTLPGSLCLKLMSIFWKSTPGLLFTAAVSSCTVSVCSRMTLMSLWWCVSTTVPPTVHFVSQWRGWTKSFGKTRGHQTNRDACVRRCRRRAPVCLCEILKVAWCITTAGGGDRETAGRAKGECNDECVWQPQWLLCSHSLVPVSASGWLICEVTGSFHST